VRLHEVGLVLAALAVDQALRTRIRLSFGTVHAWRAQVLGYVCVPRTVHVLNLDGGMEVMGSQRWSKILQDNMHSAEHAESGPG
jgi:hypothetical protein